MTQLALPVGARPCQPLPVHMVGEGFNAKCGRCWMNPCSCFAGCWECQAMPGEPGCEYCADRSTP